MGLRSGRRVPAFLLAFAGLVAAFAAPAYATNGYFQHGYGARTKALAGAGVAGAHDSLIIALNPAGLVETGNRLDVGVSLFSPRRAYEAEGGTPFAVLDEGRSKSGKELFAIPHAGAAWQLGDRSAIGFAVYGNGGMNTTYDAEDRLCPNPADGTMVPGAGIFCAGEAGVNLTQIFFSPAFAYRVTDRLSVGVSPILSWQWFKAKGVASFGGWSKDPLNLSDRGTDHAFGLGLRVGAQYKASETVRLGVSYLSPIYMDEFEKYAGLFAEDGDFNIPPALTVGTSFRLDATKTLYADYQRIWYAHVESVGNLFASPGRLGDADGPGFGWRNIDVFKVGFAWQASEDWTVRAGYAYNDQAVRKTDVLFNVLAPGVVQHHFTGGFSWRIVDGMAIDAAVMYSPEESVTGANPLDPSQTIRLEMHQLEATVGLSYSF